jgi:hypothetical protein
MNSTFTVGRHEAILEQYVGKTIIHTFRRKNVGLFSTRGVLSLELNQNEESPLMYFKTFNAKTAHATAARVDAISDMETTELVGPEKLKLLHVYTDI